MRNIISKSFVSIFALLAGTSAIFAQDRKHEVSVNIGGGLSTLIYGTEIGKRDSKAGGNFGIGYTYFFSENWGLNTGLEFSLYKAEMKTDKFNNVTQSLTDPSDGELYDFYSSISNYKEKQDASYINIPIMVQFQYGEKNKLYALAGAKIGIPVKGKYKSSASGLVNKGFFHDTANWGDTQEFMGFGTFSNYSYNEDIDFNVACILSAEVGMKWKLAENMPLYTGAYVDYGMTDIVKGGCNRSLLKLEETSEALVVQNNSILNSSLGYSSNTLTQKLTNKVVPISVGLKVRLALGL
jgi:hypothetical protein